MRDAWQRWLGPLVCGVAVPVVVLVVMIYADVRP